MGYFYNCRWRSAQFC